MGNYRDILRLYSLGHSRREIASSVHSSRNKVSEVIDLSEALQISWPFDPNISNTDLEMLLYPKRAEKNSERMPIDFPKIHRELAKKGVTRSLLWTEYCAEASAAGKLPYMSTQFSDLYRKWARVSRRKSKLLDLLRHSIGMAMYKAGIPLSYIKDFLGHSSIESTSIYAHADTESMAAALRSVDQEALPSKDRGDAAAYQPFFFCRRWIALRSSFVSFTR